MGAMCPTCQLYQPIVAVHTLDGQPPRKSEDVIFVTLGCKHAWGSKEFNEYQKIAYKIDQEAAVRHRTIQEERNEKIATEFAKFQATRKKELTKP